MIEKLGHSKRIQVMRREWIEEEKPRLSRDSGATREELENARVVQMPAKSGETPSSHPPVQDGVAEDLFIPDNETARPTTSYPEPEEDDLDDLLREDEPTADIPPKTSTSLQAPNVDEDFDAEYEAMMELGM
jgi:replication fork protection complex subunit Csm3/Swi3